MKSNWECICTGKEESGDYTNMVVFEFEGKEYQGYEITFVDKDGRCVLRK